MRANIIAAVVGAVVGFLVLSALFAFPVWGAIILNPLIGAVLGIAVFQAGRFVASFFRRPPQRMPPPVTPRSDAQIANPEALKQAGIIDER